MKAKFPISDYECPMCGADISEDANAPQWDVGFVVIYYECSQCSFHGRIFYDFAGQEGLPKGIEDDWAYAEKVE